MSSAVPFRFPPYAWPVVLIVGVQFSLMAIAFPLREVLTGQPLFHIDAAYHWYNMKLAANLAATGNAVGYDPFFAAGHVDGVHYYLSGRLPALLAALLSPGIDEIRLYKVYVFASGVLAPLALVGAALALRLSARQALIAAGLGICMWWVSYLRWYDTAGMVGYVTTCYLAVLLVALIVRYLEKGGPRWMPVALGALGAFGFFWHPIFPVPVAMGVLAYLATARRRLEWRSALTALTVIAAVSLLPNLTWLYATLRYHDGYAPSNTQNLVDAVVIWQEFLGTLRGNAHGSKVYPLLFLASLWACGREDDRERRHLWVALMLAAIFLELLAYLGGAIPAVGKIQPNRLAPAGYLFLCIPAARGLLIIGRTIADRGAGVWRPLAGAVMVAAALIGATLTWEVWREVTPGPHGRYGASPPEVRPLGEDSVWLMGWLRDRTTVDSRILFENAAGRAHDNAHMAGYYAYETQREFIGGPYPFMHFASFWDGLAFGRHLADISFERMREYFSLYNIGAIVVHSDSARRYFDAMPGVRLDAEHGVLRAYTVEAPHSYFLKGDGRVLERDHNRVLITDIVGPEIVLKYHYVPGMASDPPAHIDGVLEQDDPKPFVRIENPPQRLRLYMP